MSILTYLEESSFTEWVSLSMLGFPTLIALHSVGMAIVVGLSVVVALRLNGLLPNIDEPVLLRFFSIAAWGFTLNLVTGVALFVTRGPEYIMAAVFLIKMLLVVAAAAAVFRLGRTIRQRAADGVRAIGSLERRLSLLAVALWFGAVVAGRMIAYLSDLYRYTG